MDNSTHKTLYATHGWVGIISGILLFVVVFSGIPALFENEIEYWQSPSLTQLPKSKNFELESVMQTAVKNNFIFDEIFISPADDIRSHHILWSYNEATEDYETLYLAAHNNEVVTPGNSELAHILTELHTDLHLPSPIGRYLIGIAGLAMLLAIIAGIFIHTKWRKEFVMLREKRSWRLLLTDQHKLIGLWSLPFTFILAFTGTILGLLGLISPILAFAAFNGDVEKATQAILGPRAQITGEALPSYSLNALQAQYQKENPEMLVDLISISGLQKNAEPHNNQASQNSESPTLLTDSGGIIKFSGMHGSKLNSLQATTYQLSTGEQIHQANFFGNGPFQRIFAAVVPLHYVFYGGGWLKLFYAISALAVCGLIVSGNMLWLTRRGYNERHWLGRSTLGVCAGLVFATFSVLASSMWLQKSGADQHHLEESIFWGSWLLCLFTALVFPKSFAMSHWILRGSAAMGVLTIIGDGIMNQRWPWNSEGWVLFIHVGLLIFSALLLVVDYLLPHKISQKKSTEKTAIKEMAKAA